MGRVPRDDKGAAVLCGGRSDRHGPDRSVLGHAAAGIAELLLTHWYAANHNTAPVNTVLVAQPQVARPPDPVRTLQPLGVTDSRKGVST